MEFHVKSGQPEKQRTNCLIVPIFEARRLGITAEKIDKQCEGFLTTLARKGDLEGKLGQTLLLMHLPGLSTERLLLVGCGREGELNEQSFTEIVNKVISTLNDSGALEGIFCLSEIPVKNRDIAWKIRQTIQILHQAQYRFEDFKSKKTTLKRSLRRLIFMVASRRDAVAAENAVREGLAITHGMELAKDLANTPPNICTPTYLADKAKKFAKSHPKISTAVLEEKDMAALGMGSFLSVTQGSNLAAKLITMEYRGGKKDLKPIVFVGKGITFDTGGNSIKVPPHMIGMKYDMCGAATVFGVLAAAAELELPLNIVGVIPSCENMPGPSATRPEDIVTSMSGLTIEILNTDAEGRLILADALTYCERYHPQVVIDIATLTGACMLALGPYASGLMSNNDALADSLFKAGTQSSDKVWQLPLWDEYHDALKSEFPR